MRKLFTLAAMLLLMVVSANAKQLVCDLSSLPATSQNTTWTSATNTFAWSASSWNATTLPGFKGNLTGYETLNIDLGETTEAFRIFVKYNNDGNSITLWVNKNCSTISGLQTINLSENGVTSDIIQNISSIMLSGPNWEAGNSSGSVVINSIYLEGPDTKVYYPEILFPTNVTDLDKTLFHNWTAADGTGTITETAVYPSVSIAVSTGCPYGDPNVYYLNYADLSTYSKLVVIANDGQPRFCFNRLEDQGTVNVEFPRDKESKAYETVIDNGGGVSTYIIDLKSIVTEAGFAHLHCIKGANYANTTIIKMFVVNENGSVASIDEARTYSSSEVLDFTNVTNVEAYIATACDGTNVTMKKVTGAVPANTGIVLKQVNDYSYISIPTCAEATEDVTGNLLVATTAETTVSKAETGTNYVLGGTGATLGWYSINGTSATLAANKCYLHAPSSGAKSLTMSFGENETTGISSVRSEERVVSSSIYNLAGQRVNANAKGIVIINGKKYIK